MGNITLRAAKIVCLNLTIGCIALHVIAKSQQIIEVGSTGTH
jgi:hypothetical protein